MEEKKGAFSLELIASIIIGIATVFGAWAAYQSSLWSGNSVEAYNIGLKSIIKANGLTIQGFQKYSLDMLSWMEYRKASGINFSSKDIRDKVMSPEMKKSLDWTDQVNKEVMLEFSRLSSLAGSNMSDAEQQKLYNDFVSKIDQIKQKATNEIYKQSRSEEIDSWEIQSPRTDPNYEAALLAESDSIYKYGDEKISEGSNANNMDDKYTLVTVFFTIVLFFAGISTTLEKHTLKVGFIAVSAVLLIFSIIRLLMLQMN